VKIDKGKRVRIKIKLTETGGRVIEDSIAEYFHGAGTILPGLERVLEGLAAGAQKRGLIPAVEAFDAVKNLPTKKIPRAEFPAEVELKVGATFAAKTPDGAPITFCVQKVTDKEVEVRFEHPLAGKDIGYEVEVLAVVDPTPPPLPADAVARDEA
jgi:FKBP-type peptidyl-prolyl cis-trans isomerase SlyD